MRSLSIVAALAICVMLVGCKKTHEDVIKETISCMNDVGTALKSAKDEASAKKAAADIKSIGERITKLAETAKDMPKPTDQEDKALQDKYKKQLDDAMGTITTEMMRIMADPKLQPAADAFKAIGESMSKLSK
jgi:hypothetical protein